MSILHTVNKSPFTHTTLQECLALCDEANDSLLFIENGAYATLANSPLAEQLQGCMALGLKVYVLSSSLEARGIVPAEGIEHIDEEGFVALTVSHTLCHSWY